MGQQQQTIIEWSCDYRGCSAKAQSYDELDTPQGWLSLVGAYQDTHGGGPARLDLCPVHALSFSATYNIHSHEELEDE